jgi:DHA1 family tetracycline resistance protein-like MFS transporter
MPTLITQMIHGNLSVASEYGGWLTFAYSFMQFICAPIVGNLSDKYGRRPFCFFLCLVLALIIFFFLLLQQSGGYLSDE